MLRRALVALAVLSIGGPLLAQSLGEVAEKEKERREREKKPAKSFTDEDLRKGKPTPKDKDKDAGSKQEPEQPAAVAPSPEGEDSDDAARARAADEAYWRRAAQEHRDRIRRAEEKVQALQARIDALMVDRNPPGADALDPNRLQTIEAQKAQAREELDKAKAELAAARAALEDLEEQARRKSVPPGWLREP